MSLSRVKQFMDQYQTGVVATVAVDGSPQAATVGLSLDNDFCFLFATNKNTRKYQNLLASNQVAIVVGTEGAATLQYQGIAKEVTKDSLGKRLDEHFTKVPGARKHAGKEGEVYFLVHPSWLRLTDYAQEEPIFETRQFK